MDTPDYRDIKVPDIDDDGNHIGSTPQYRKLASPKLTAKFGYIAAALSILVIAGQLTAPMLGIPASIWAYFPFLWVGVLAISIWGLFADDKKSFDVFGIVGSFVFGIPTIVLSIDLLSSL